MANPTVTIEIREIGADRVIRSLKNVERAAGRVSGAKRRLSGQARKTGQSFKESGKNVGRFSILMQNLETNAVLALGPLACFPQTSCSAKD